MANFNRVLLLGNLTRDPQLKYLPSQTPVVEFGLACNRKYKTQTGEDREEATFVECAAFGRPAEIINQYCTKGRPLFIEGRLKYDSWEDKQGGGKRNKLSVVVENFQLLGGAPGGGGGGGGEGGAAQGRGSRPPQQRPQRASTGGSAGDQGGAAPAGPPISEEQQFHEDDIPF
jgi:single-strand DNA-binding protein